MNAKNKLLTVVCGLVLGFAATAARAQDATPAQVREEVHQLITDMQDPNYDFSKIPDRMQKTFQDFRAATQSMDQDTSQQFRQDLMSKLMPVMQANQQKIRDAMRMAFLKSLQQPMGCSDDEFAAIRPYLEKVVDAFDASQLNRFRGGPPNGTQNSNNPQSGQISAVQQAASDLQSTLNDTNSKDDLIKNKLDILRQAQGKAKQDLNVARSQLKDLLTQRQEAVLVEYGLLD
jgi:hypothetical protein